MSTEDSLSSKILTNVEFIADVYNIVNIAASKALDLSSIKNKNGKIKPGVVGEVNLIRKDSGKNRYSANCRAPIKKNRRNNINSDICIKTDNYFIVYDKNDITIVGGAALNIYDYLLKEYKHRRGIASMEEYIKRKTSDIDMVWWPKFTGAVNNPNIPITDEIVVSSSQSIMQLVANFKNTLAQELDMEDNKKRLLKQIIPFLERGDNDSKLLCKVEWMPFYAAGVHKIEVEFKISDISFKLIDISIHDGGASQKFDLNGNLITNLRLMEEDPVYSTPDVLQINSIKSFPVSFENGSSSIVRVPSIYSLVQQQMFAFDNLIRDSQEKGLINYKRVEYIKLLLENWQNSNENYRYIIGQPISQELNYIEERQKYSFDRIGNQIIKVCKLKSNKPDMYVDKLCNQVVMPIRKEIINELDRIYKQFDDTYQITRDERFKKYKKQMFELRGNIEKLKNKYRGINANKLFTEINMSKPFRESKEITDLTEEERKIRAEIIQIQRSNSIRLENQRVKEDIPRRMREDIMVAPMPTMPTMPTIEFDSRYLNTMPDGTVIYITRSGIRWYYQNQARKLGLTRYNPFTGIWEIPERKDPVYGLPPPPPVPSIPSSYGPPIPSQSFVQPNMGYSQFGHPSHIQGSMGYSTSSLRTGGRKKTSRKNRRNNITMKK